jgi:hypothetical protein
MTLEDIIPVWVQSELPAGDPWIHQARGSGGSWRTRDAVVWKVKDVCQKCNNGWMSRLEGQVKPLIREAIQGKPCQWSTIEQRRVSTWAFKTALMALLGLGITDLVPSSHFKTLYRERRPRV